jgi:hypothetical protein
MGANGVLPDDSPEFAMKKANILLVFIFLLAACRQAPAQDSPAMASQTISACGENLKAMQALTGGLELPASFRTKNPVKNGGEFDVMQYFTVLDHLSMQPGYVMDYIYHYDGLGGYPRLYAHPVDQAPFVTEAELDAGGDKPNYLDFVQTDDSPEGYFQYVLLAIMGNQFYLDWHANYNDSQLICDKTAVLAAVTRTDQGFGKPMPLTARLQAVFLQYVEPLALKGDQTVEIRIITFSLWGGFYRQTYTLQRHFPHAILNTQKQNLVPYDCGVMF